MKRPAPVGHYVLVEIPEVSETTEGGIILSSSLTSKEERAQEQGQVIAIGSCAYVGWAGCQDPNSPAHSQWGINVGDYVEFRKYEGKDSVIEGFERYRFIPDTHIVGKVIDEEE